MSEHEGPEYDDLRDSWVESLLQSATRPEEHADRIADVLRRLEAVSVSSPSAPERLQRRLVRWGTIGVAAVLLIGLSLIFVPGLVARTAEAAVDRSLGIAAERVTREYALEVTLQSPTGESRTTIGDLFVQGNDRFVLRYPGLLAGTNAWLGRNGAESWVIPAFGPVLKGNDTGLGRWLRSRGDLDTPYLHVTTVLTRMKSRGYRLSALEDVRLDLPDGRAIECQRVRARRSGSDPSDRPDTIELWASRESGMALRVIARWNVEDGESGRASVTLTYRNDAPFLADDWFTAEAHYSGSRRVVRMDK